ncbi:hypothetical protein TELCIR_13126 [Teladorsagia circumcincta]|uniref:Uncharacterized protein n=1 Tax=Teladorsagia circumcincta TaxID=45464 RepID=A0A2G9U4L0_TELCI|nr:hypothetical protein TELCIR_13126 [Teladorsagia circumcincta]
MSQLILGDRSIVGACYPFVSLGCAAANQNFCRFPIMSERQQMEKIQQLADLKVQLQMAAMEAAVAKAEAEKVTS